MAIRRAVVNGEEEARGVTWIAGRGVEEALETSANRAVQLFDKRIVGVAGSDIPRFSEVRRKIPAVFIAETSSRVAKVIWSKTSKYGRSPFGAGE